MQGDHGRVVVARFQEENDLPDAGHPGHLASDRFDERRPLKLAGDRSGELVQHRQRLDLAAILGKQPRVLERDRGLRGEALQPLDVVTRERRRLLPAPVHRDHTEQLVTDEQRLRDRRAKADGDELGQRVRRGRVVVDEERLAQLGGRPDEALSHRDVDVTEGPAVGPGARHELVAFVEQVDGAVAVEQITGVVDDQAKQTIGLQLGRQFALDRRERFSLGHQPSVTCFHLRDDRQRQHVQQDRQRASRQGEQDEEGRGRLHDAILAHGDFDEAHRTGPVLRRHADPGRLRVPPPRAVRDDRFGERRVTAVEDPNPQNLGLSLPRLLEIRRAAAREPGGDVTGEASRCNMEPSDLEQVVRSRRAQPHHDRHEEGQAPEPPAQPATERTFKLVNHSIDYRRSAPLRWQIFEHFG